MRFIKKNIFMTVFFLVVAPLASYVGYNTIYKPYGEEISSFFKTDNPDLKKSVQSTKVPVKEKRESNTILTNKKQDDNLPAIEKEKIEFNTPISADNTKNSTPPLEETDGFENLDPYIQNPDKQKMDSKADTKIDPNIASDDIYGDMLNDNQTSSQLQKEFNIDIPEEKNNKKQQEDAVSSNVKKDNKKSDHLQGDLMLAPSDSVLGEKAISDVTKDLESRNNGDLDSKTIDNILGEKTTPVMPKELGNQKSDSVPPVLGNDIIGETGIITMNKQIEKNTKGQILKPTDNVLGEEAKIDFDSKDIVEDSQDNTSDILPKVDDNVLEEQSEKDNTTVMSSEDKKSEAQKKALEGLEITEDLFPMSPSPKFQGITPDAPDDATLVQNKLSAQNTVKTSTDNIQTQKQQGKIDFQPIKLSSAECLYEHEIDSKNMQETFRLMISPKKAEKPLTMEVTRQLDLLDYVTMTTDDIDGYPDSFTQLSVFCDRMTVRKILNEDYPNLSSPPISASSVPSP